MIFALFIATITLFDTTHANLYTLYAHGIVDKPSQIKRFTDAIITDKEHTKAVKFDDCNKETGYGLNRAISEITTKLKKPINRSKMHMGQGKDLQAVNHALQQIPHNANIILYGCSRGGSTILKYLGKHNPTNIAAVVLDAAPTNMPATLHPILAKAGIHQSYDRAIFSTLFPCYPKNCTTPLQAIKNIKNKQLPIMIIHSQDDKNVPFVHALKLYIEAKKHGFEYIYLVRISNGRHNFLLQDSTVKDQYLTAVHSFYKKHNLPHNQQYAQDNMTQYQPDTKQLEEEVIQFEKNLQKQYEQSKTHNYMVAAISVAALLTYLYHKNYMKKDQLVNLSIPSCV